MKSIENLSCYLIYERIFIRFALWKTSKFVFYFKIGDSHKCMTIVVTLKNKPLEKYPDLQGTYQLESSRSEPRWKSKWKSNIRHKAIWYDVEQKSWAIGDTHSMLWQI